MTLMRYPIILRHDDGTAVLASTIDPDRAGLSVPCHCNIADELESERAAGLVRIPRELDA